MPRRLSPVSPPTTIDALTTRTPESSGAPPAVAADAVPEPEAASAPSGTPTLKTRGGGLPADFELTPELAAAFEQMEHGPACLFVTGRAGTGKSTLLQLFRHNTQHRTAVVAPTGAAAITARGQTIHSFFRFPPRPLAAADIKRRKRRKVYEALEVLIIDEVSMVRADLLDGIDQFLRLNGPQEGEPFGGVRLILIGDPYQLPPVVRRGPEQDYLRAHYKTPYFFSARVLRETGLATCELGRIFRQRDDRFIELLNAIRSGRPGRQHLDALNARCEAAWPAEEDAPYITLTPTNRRAHAINAARLAALDGRVYTFEAEQTGSFEETSDANLPTGRALTLKEGAQVMFVKNDPGRRWVNGTLGRVFKLRDDLVEVEVGLRGRGEVVTVEPTAWEMLRYRYDAEAQNLKAEVAGTFTQVPLLLAYAITIHKSQGKTFDRVLVDLGGRAFAHGQTYVALSRCRSLDGLALTAPLTPRDVRLDRAVTLFHQHRHRLHPDELLGA